MPVRNAVSFLDEAVETILAQSCGDFEFVILDDASTDGSRERLREWSRRDHRIRLIESATALGPVGSSNRVAMAATSPIIARMDADDVADPDRFRCELDVLERHPDAVLVGSLADSIDATGRLVLRRDRSVLLRDLPRAPIAHASIMYRADAFWRIGGYRDEAAYFEDADLYRRMAAQGRILIIPRPLVCYRFSGENSRLREPPQVAEQAADRYFTWLAGGNDALPRGDPDARVSAAAIFGLASMQLWAGHRPKVIGRLIRRSRLGWDRRTLRVLAGALWAAASPGSLRAALRLRDRWRDVAASRHIDEHRVYEWRPPQTATLDVGAPIVPAGDGAFAPQ